MPNSAPASSSHSARLSAKLRSTQSSNASRPDDAARCRCDGSSSARRGRAGRPRGRGRARRSVASTSAAASPSRRRMTRPCERSVTAASVDGKRGLEARDEIRRRRPRSGSGRARRRRRVTPCRGSRCPERAAPRSPVSSAITRSAPFERVGPGLRPAGSSRRARSRQRDAARRQRRRGRCARAEGAQPCMRLPSLSKKQGSTTSTGPCLPRSGSAA